MEQKVKSGIKSTEFWVAAIILVPFLANQFGLDISGYFPTDPEGMGALIETARADLAASQQMSSNAPTWAGIAYIVSRTLVKLFVKP